MPDVESRARLFPWLHKGIKWETAYFNAIEAKIVDPETGKEFTKPGEIESSASEAQGL